MGVDPELSLVLLLLPLTLLLVISWLQPSNIKTTLSRSCLISQIDFCRRPVVIQLYIPCHVFLPSTLVQVIVITCPPSLPALQRTNMTHQLLRYKYYGSFVSITHSGLLVCLVLILSYSKSYRYLILVDQLCDFGLDYIFLDIGAIVGSKGGTGHPETTIIVGRLFKLHQVTCLALIYLDHFHSLSILVLISLAHLPKTVLKSCLCLLLFHGHLGLIKYGFFNCLSCQLGKPTAMPSHNSEFVSLFAWYY